MSAELIDCDNCDGKGHDEEGLPCSFCQGACEVPKEPRACRICGLPTVTAFGEYCEHHRDGIRRLLGIAAQVQE